MAIAAWDAGIDDWEDELDRPDGHPLIASALGAVVIIMVSLFAWGLTPVDVSQHAAATLIVALVLAGVVWSAAWYLTIRFASPAWLFAAGAIFIVVALAMAGLTIAGAIVATRVDVATMQRIGVDSAGLPSLPRGTRQGPITRRTMRFYREMVDQNRARNLFYSKLGIDKLTQAWALTANPALIQDCERFPRSRPELDAINNRILDMTKTYRADLATMIGDKKLLQQVLTGLDVNFSVGGARRDHQVQLVHEQLDLASKMCVILARKRWRPQGNMIGFLSTGDLAGYRALAQRWDAVLGELRGTPPPVPMPMAPGP
ncbi:MAG: hypothetical protein V4459_08220 [Pseudomonadota bacterium]